MSAEGQAPTAGEYIIHHLTHLQSATPKSVVDFSVFHWDSIFFTSLLGVLGCCWLWAAARKATSGVPGRFQAAVEILFEMVETQAKGIVHNAKSRKLVSPLALVVFIWIFPLNAMDLLPVDLLPFVWEKIVGGAGLPGPRRGDCPLALAGLLHGFDRPRGPAAGKQQLWHEACHPARVRRPWPSPGRGRRATPWSC